MARVGVVVVVVGVVEEEVVVVRVKDRLFGMDERPVGGRDLS